MKSLPTSLPRSKSGALDARDLRRAFIKELRRILRRTAHDSGSRHVHAVRKDITKLRSWLRLARELIGPRRFQKHNRQLRRAARALAPIRDARVMPATFEAISSGSSFPRTDQRLRKQGRCAKTSLPAAMRKVNHRLKKELAASKQLPLEKITVADFAAALERMRGEMEAAAAAARVSGSMESLHTWRKRTKNYLHALAFVEGQKHRHYRAAARINHLLGEDHDLALLAAETTAIGDKSESHPLLAAIARRRAKLQAQFSPK